MPDLTVSIINYKTKELTEKCIKSILDKKWKISLEIWIVDNASEDGSVGYLRKIFPQVKYIGSHKNLGFAGGHNLVLKQNKSRYVLILNSDTLILDKTLDKMVEFMDSDSQIGLASCKVLGFDGNLQPNGGDLPFGLALLGWLFNLETFGLRKPAFHRNDNEYYNGIHEVGWVSGSFMIIRQEVLGSVGFLNDNYFMYFEDVEFCFKVRNKGFKVMINPEVSIKHLSGGSLENPRFRQWLGEYKGLIYFYKKQYGAFIGTLIKVLVYKSIILRMIVFSLTGKFEFAKTYGQIIIHL